MMKVGIAIDTWKLDIFRRRLTEAGYTFEQTTGPAGTLLLTVVTVNHKALESVVRSANEEARRSRMS